MSSHEYDQRHRFVLSGGFAAPWKIHVGGVATVASGLAYNIVTGTTNSGDTGTTTDRPVVNGAVIRRNARSWEADFTMYLRLLNGSSS